MLYVSLKAIIWSVLYKPVLLVSRAIKICTVVPKVCGTSLLNALHVTFLVPRNKIVIFWEIFIPLILVSFFIWEGSVYCLNALNKKVSSCIFYQLLKYLSFVITGTNDFELWVVELSSQLFAKFVTPHSMLTAPILFVDSNKNRFQTDLNIITEDSRRVNFRRQKQKP